MTTLISLIGCICIILIVIGTLGFIKVLTIAAVTRGSGNFTLSRLYIIIGTTGLYIIHNYTNYG